VALELIRREAEVAELRRDRVRGVVAQDEHARFDAPRDLLDGVRLDAWVEATGDGGRHRGLLGDGSVEEDDRPLKLP
jgi:hypothetical protein